LSFIDQKIQFRVLHAPYGTRDLQNADGWWAQDSMLVEHESGRRFEMSEELYRASKYEPPFEELPAYTKLSECKSK
jgi:hypothetical protein